MALIDEVVIKSDHLTGRGSGQRKNNNKLRYDLAPAFAQQEYVRVLTEGSKKYADRNWENGMTWSSVIASLERHLAAFKRGEDFDPETGCYHTAQIMTNSAFITQFYKIFPEGDDRAHNYFNRKRIGLDVDEVIADFVSAYMHTYGINVRPEFWNFDPKLGVRLTEELPVSWWAGLRPLIRPEELTFEPTCYITSRPVDSMVTVKWLADHKFPCVPVFTVKSPEEKVEIAKDARLDIFVDDRYETFVDMNKAGICCFLFDAAHNRRYNVGYKRIKSLHELTNF